MTCNIVPVSDLPADVHEKLFHAGLRPLVYRKEDGEQLLAYLLDEDGLYWGWVPVKKNPPASEEKV